MSNRVDRRTAAVLEAVDRLGRVAKERESAGDDLEDRLDELEPHAHEILHLVDDHVTEASDVSRFRIVPDERGGAGDRRVEAAVWSLSGGASHDPPAKESMVDGRT